MGVIHSISKNLHETSKSFIEFTLTHENSRNLIQKDFLYKLKFTEIFIKLKKIIGEDKINIGEMIPEEAVLVKLLDVNISDIFESFTLTQNLFDNEDFIIKISNLNALLSPEQKE